MKISTENKLALGSVLSVFGALSFILSMLFGWAEAASPWNFLIGFVVGVITGLGATLVIAGLIERRKNL